MENNPFAVTFVRGARRVTGSNFLLEAGGKHILIDCGLIQGDRFCDPGNTAPFPYDPKSIDTVFFTHAHADHIGLFPKLVKAGFTGKAYATAATKALMPIMLEDSVNLIADEAERCGYEPPYLGTDVHTAVGLLQDVSYGSPVRVSDDVSVTLFNAAHILGSAMALVEVSGAKILFTGDLGRSHAALVPDIGAVGDVDYLVLESVYGNRVHGSIDGSREALYRAVNRTAEEKGVLLIPSFSLERTQIILASLSHGIAEGKVKSIPVFMDSPLAAKVTEVYRTHPTFLREDIRKEIEAGRDPFSFHNLSVTVNIEDSRMIEERAGAKVIIAGAGMSHGGRIRRHEARYLPDQGTTVLLVGYQSAGSLGRRLRDGEREVKIDGQQIKVRAQIVTTDGFSAHADRDDLMAFTESVKPKKVFVVLGETESATFLAQRISGFYGIDTVVPREGETYSLELEQ